MWFLAQIYIYLEHDYPDAFEAWNNVASIGSIISVFSVIFFLYTIYDLLYFGKKISDNPWKKHEITMQFFKKTVLKRIFLYKKYKNTKFLTSFFISSSFVFELLLMYWTLFHYSNFKMS